MTITGFKQVICEQQHIPWYSHFSFEFLVRCVYFLSQTTTKGCQKIVELRLVKPQSHTAPGMCFYAESIIIIMVSATPEQSSPRLIFRRGEISNRVEYFLHPDIIDLKHVKGALTAGNFSLFLYINNQPSKVNMWHKPRYQRSRACHYCKVISKKP